MTAAPTRPPPVAPKKNGAPPPPPPNGNGGAPAASADRPRLGKRTVDHLGHRLVVNAVEGWGKTSLIAYAPKPALIQVGGETGYDTLLGAGRAPSIDSAHVTTWADLLAVIGDIATASEPYGVLGLDALGGAERACHEFVCARDFDNNWGEKGFTAFQRGFDVSVTELLRLLTELDKVRIRGTHVVILAHTKVATFKNPEGADYDKYVSDCHAKTWSVTHKWADAVLFGNFYVDVEGGKTGEKAKKGKGVGTNQRVLYTEHRAAFDAKNRFGMPESMDIPNDPAQIWNTIFGQISPAKE